MSNLADEMASVDVAERLGVIVEWFDGGSWHRPEGAPKRFHLVDVPGNEWGASDGR